MIETATFAAPYLFRSRVENNQEKRREGFN